jgi:hypothetical protein
MSIRIAAAAILLAAGSAAAQEPGPLDPEARTAGIAYRSAFDDYRTFVDPKPADWRSANDEVRDAGGHLGLARGRGPGAHTSRPQPGSAEASGGAAEKGGMHGGHHK